MSHSSQKSLFALHVPHLMIFFSDSYFGQNPIRIKVPDLIITHTTDLRNSKWFKISKVFQISYHLNIFEKYETLQSYIFLQFLTKDGGSVSIRWFTWNCLRLISSWTQSNNSSFHWKVNKYEDIIYGWF